MQISAAFYRGNKTFEVKEIDSTPPGDGEVQIEVGYCGVCGTDLHVYLGHMDARVGFSRILGHEMAGVVRAVGSGVSDFGPGDRVVVRPLDHCGDCPACNAGHSHICHKLKFIGLDSDGAMQGLWNVPSHTLHSIPDNVSLRDASMIEPLAVAFHDVSRAKLSNTDDVLVIGGGPIGLLIALAARLTTPNVTIVEINSHRRQFAGDLGFTVLDPGNIDVADEIAKATRGTGADVVFEVSGSQGGVDLMTRCAATRARIVMVAIHAQKPSIDLFQFFWREIEMLGARVYEPKDYDDAIRAIGEGRIDVGALITDVRPLRDVSTAFEELTRNPKAMKTLITIAGDV